MFFDTVITYFNQSIIENNGKTLQVIHLTRSGGIDEYVPVIVGAGGLELVI